MSAANETYALMHRFEVRSIRLSFDDANTLRKAQKVLHRWSEQECGDGNAYASWSIERDEQTGVPYLCTYPHTGTMRKHRIADREAGAMKRIAEVCKRNGLHYFHQTDPRGCALYVSSQPLTDSSYSSNGVSCC